MVAVSNIRFSILKSLNFIFLIPLQVLRQAGLEADKDFTLRRFDLLVGKHGDHVGGELEALRSLQRGESAAVPCWI